MKEQEVRAEVKAVIDELLNNGPTETDAGLVMHPFKMMGGDRLIVTNQHKGDELIAYKYKSGSKRLMLFPIAEEAFEAMVKIGDKEVVWCKSAQQRLMNVHCALRQCKNGDCKDDCEYLINRSPVGKAAKKKVPVEPVLVEQHGYKRGRKEMVDKNVYMVEIVCSCGNHRWIKPQDAFQVKSCKPCAHKAKLKRIREWRKNRRVQG